MSPEQGRSVTKTQETREAEGTERRGNVTRAMFFPSASSTRQHAAISVCETPGTISLRSSASPAQPRARILKDARAANFTRSPMRVLDRACRNSTGTRPPGSAGSRPDVFLGKLRGSLLFVPHAHGRAPELSGGRVPMLLLHALSVRIPHAVRTITGWSPVSLLPHQMSSSISSISCNCTCAKPRTAAGLSKNGR